ncbi:transcription initiation factor TFIID [Tritrichomonas foetus]|uniref:Transcription initiation factor TFIID n=1 Tax=Tritrichomonas foetus TaxID=1144522 RepID=A0A1J4JYS3_9EUKA|nr:transcription initiation factor TFIID [Tritrichomonas foetus]|eukprot:OHT04123.1 transcription initiation factor TFIID [Tritrichomonas foetus]
MASSFTVQAISQELGVNIANQIDVDDVAKDAEAFISTILDLANRIRKHRSGKILKVNDLNNALISKTGQPLYGYKSNQVGDFKSVGVLHDVELLAKVDRQISLSEITSSPLKKYPVDTCFDFHWLAINGIQPQIEENAGETKPSATLPQSIGQIPEQTKLSDQPVQMISSKLMVSKELQQFYLKSLETIKKQSNVANSTTNPDFAKLIESFSRDAAIQPLLQFFLRTIWDTISLQSRSTNQLQISLSLTKALFSNPNLDCEPFLQNFTSIAMTLMIHQSLGEDLSDGVIQLRSSAADFLGIIIQKFSNKYPNLQQRVAEHLSSIIFDPRVQSISQFGAALGLQSIDPSVVRMFLIPHLQIILNKLKMEINHPDPMQRTPAMYLHGAILRLCGLCYHHDTSRHIDEQELSRIYTKAAAYFGNDFISFASHA